MPKDFSVETDLLTLCKGKVAKRGAISVPDVLEKMRKEKYYQNSKANSFFRLGGIPFRTRGRG